MKDPRNLSDNGVVGGTRPKSTRAGLATSRRQTRPPGLPMAAKSVAKKGMFQRQPTSGGLSRGLLFCQSWRPKAGWSVGAGRCRAWLAHQPDATR